MNETKTIPIRGVQVAIAEKFARAAASRGMTQAEYFERLVALRDCASLIADSGDRESLTDQTLAEWAKVLRDEMVSMNLDSVWS